VVEIKYYIFMRSTFVWLNGSLSRTRSFFVLFHFVFPSTSFLLFSWTLFLFVNHEGISIFIYYFSVKYFGMLHRKDMSIVGSLTFQPYNPPLYAFSTMKVNLSMLNLTLNVKFSNNEGRKRIHKFVLKKKSNNKEVFNFQSIQCSNTIFT
jgi:hypothetical protein